MNWKESIDVKVELSDKGKVDLFVLGTDCVDFSISQNVLKPSLVISELVRNRDFASVICPTAI